MAEYVETRRTVDVRRQRDEYGGTNWGAAFFGWLVAVGIGALLTAFVSAAGAAVAISEIEDATEAVANADTIGIVGVLALLAIALIAYYGGGYVAGRMSRFDGARQGVGVWAWGIVAAIVLAILGAIAGSEYNLFADLDLPRVPVDEGEVTTGGVILLAVALIGTLLAAMAGGKAGERYHRRVDSVGDGRAELRDRDRDGDVDAEDRVYEDRPRRSFRERVTS
jgi:amino acid transporter